MLYLAIHLSMPVGKAEVLDYLLDNLDSTHINCQAQNTHTHTFTAQVRIADGVRILLQHMADFNKFSTTPRQIAALSVRAAEPPKKPPPPAYAPGVTHS